MANTESNVVEITETRADKFTRLARQRMNAALKRLRLLENLANKTQYEYSEEQVERIEDVLNEAVARIIDPMRANTDKATAPAFDF